MIYKPSLVQEQVLGGLSADLNLIKNSSLSLSIPLQLTVFHQGGQIDVIDEPLQTLVNSALGFKLKLPFSGWIKDFRTENYLISFNDFSFTDVQPFSKGYGWYLNAGFDTHKLGSFMGTFWKGEAFISTDGMPLYQSVSQHIVHQGYNEKNRKLFILRYSYQQKLIQNLYMDFRFEPMMDLGRPAGSRKIEFSNSSFLMYKQEFRLHKAKGK
jgi:hypothetical protein